MCKLEKRLKVWSFQWLSRVGYLVLIKSALEAIPIYWMSLAWIPRGTLDKMWRLCFRFLWVGSKDQYVLPWVNWHKLVVPKLLGYWALKNIFHFSKALSATSASQLISSQNLWAQVVIYKYIEPFSVEDWIRLPVKSRQNILVIWWAIIHSFNMVVSVLVWRIRDGMCFRIGFYPWLGCTQEHVLSLPLITYL